MVFAVFSLALLFVDDPLEAERAQFTATQREALEALVKTYEDEIARMRREGDEGTAARLAEEKKFFEGRVTRLLLEVERKKYVSVVGDESTSVDDDMSSSFDSKDDVSRLAFVHKEVKKLEAEMNRQARRLTEVEFREWLAKEVEDIDRRVSGICVVECQVDDLIPAESEKSKYREGYDLRTDRIWCAKAGRDGPYLSTGGSENLHISRDEALKIKSGEILRLKARLFVAANYGDEKLYEPDDAGPYMYWTFGSKSGFHVRLCHGQWELSDSE